MPEVKHTFVSGIADGPDATLVRPSNWNAAHTLTGIAFIASGSYTGENTVNKAIAHGFGVAPKLVFIMSTIGNRWFRIITGWAYISHMASGSSSSYSVTAPDATNFYVGNASNYSESANITGVTYYWVAIG